MVYNPCIFLKKCPSIYKIADFFLNFNLSSAVESKIQIKNQLTIGNFFANTLHCEKKCSTSNIRYVVFLGDTRNYV